MEPAQPRGAPQIIPRPDQWELGGPPPWHHLSNAERALTLDGVVERIQARGPGKDLGSTFVPESSSKSAVLCTLFEDRGEPWVILTRRSAMMRRHTREISFPGGRRDETDDSFQETALREAWEEIGLEPSSVAIVGELDRFVTGGSGSQVHPFVGVVAERPQGLVANPAEVESIRIAALAELLSDDAWREEYWTRKGVRARITFFELEGDTVWGATASMLRSLLVTALRL